VSKNIIQVSAKIPKKMCEFLDDLIKKGYAKDRTGAIIYCIQYTMDKMDVVDG